MSGLGLLVGALVKRLGPLWSVVAGVGLLLLLVLGPLVLAYHAGYEARDRKAVETNQAQRIASLQTLLSIGHRADVVVGDYILRRGTTALVYRTLREEVRHVVTLYRPAPAVAAVPQPACLFTRGFVRVWDDALSASHDAAGLPADPDRAADAAAAAAAPGDDEAAPGVDRAALLDNHLANAESATDARNKLDAINEWDRATFGARTP